MKRWKTVDRADKDTVAFINENKNRSSLLANDIEHHMQDIKRLEEEISGGQIDMEAIDRKIAEHAAVLEELKAKSRKISAGLEELTRESRELDLQAGEKGSLLESIKAEMIELTAEENSANAVIANLDILGSNFLERKGVVEGELTDQTKNRDSLQESVLKAQENYENCVSEGTELQKEIHQLESRITDLASEQKQLLEEKNRCQLFCNQKQSRQAMLRDMEKEYEGYAKGVRGVMTAYQKGVIADAKIYGPLAQLIKTEEKYIAAVETALGAANQNIVTEAEEDAKAAIAYLKKNHLGRATFLPIQAVRPREFSEKGIQKENGFLAIASDLISCEDRYKDIVRSFLGSTVVCDSLDHAISIARKYGHKFRIVTLEGDVIQAGGAMTGGSALKTTGSLSRMGEIEKLESEILQYQKDLEEYTMKLREVSRDQEKDRALLQEKLTAYQELQQKTVRLETELSHQTSLLETMSAGFSQMQAELENILKRLDDIEKEKQEKNEKILFCREEYAKKERELECIQGEFSALNGKNESIVARLTELNIEKNTVLKDMEMQNEHISRLNTEKSQHLVLISARGDEISALRQQNESIEQEMKSLEAEVGEKEDSLKRFHQDLERLIQEKNQLELTLRNKQSPRSKKYRSKYFNFLSNRVRWSLVPKNMKKRLRQLSIDCWRNMNFRTVKRLKYNRQVTLSIGKPLLRSALCGNKSVLLEISILMLLRNIKM